ncbi:MAG: YtxH domain-containing protein [Terriglobia bacterium]|nr:YtxH domain-containing protein [Terriglobia bacterium]
MKFLLGLGIGVALGTVFAPASGVETRRWLKQQSREISRLPIRKVREAFENTREKAGEMGARAGRKATESAIEAVENKIVG